MTRSACMQLNSKLHVNVDTLRFFATSGIE